MRTTPRVALTQQQREQNAVADVCKHLLDGLNMKRGLSRKTNKTFRKVMGISPTTWWHWNNGGIAEAEFGKVVTAAMRVGVEIKVEIKV